MHKGIVDNFFGEEKPARRRIKAFASLSRKAAGSQGSALSRARRLETPLLIPAKAGINKNLFRARPAGRKTSLARQARS